MMHPNRDYSGNVRESQQGIRVYFPEARAVWRHKFDANGNTTTPARSTEGSSVENIVLILRSQSILFRRFPESIVLPLIYKISYVTSSCTVQVLWISDARHHNQGATVKIYLKYSSKTSVKPRTSRFSPLPLAFWNRRASSATTQSSHQRSMPRSCDARVDMR